MHHVSFLNGVLLLERQQFLGNGTKFEPGQMGEATLEHNYKHFLNKRDQFLPDLTLRLHRASTFTEQSVCTIAARLYLKSNRKIKMRANRIFCSSYSCPGLHV
jgi:hypothetical protein